MFLTFLYGLEFCYLFHDVEKWSGTLVVLESQGGHRTSFCSPALNTASRKRSSNHQKLSITPSLFDPLFDHSFSCEITEGGGAQLKGRVSNQSFLGQGMEYKGRWNTLDPQAITFEIMAANISTS